MKYTKHIDLARDLEFENNVVNINKSMQSQLPFAYSFQFQQGELRAFPSQSVKAKIESDDMDFTLI